MQSLTERSDACDEIDCTRGWRLAAIAIADVLSMSLLWQSIVLLSKTPVGHSPNITVLVQILTGITIGEKGHFVPFMIGLSVTCTIGTGLIDYSWYTIRP